MIGNMRTGNRRKIANYQILSNFIADVIMWKLKYDMNNHLQRFMDSFKLFDFQLYLHYVNNQLKGPTSCKQKINFTYLNPLSLFLIQYIIYSYE
ncbi:hypothetical protein D3C87_327200 [compost metagenome]